MQLLRFCTDLLTQITTFVLVILFQEKLSHAEGQGHKLISHLFCFKITDRLHHWYKTQQMTWMTCALDYNLTVQSFLLMVKSFSFTDLFFQFLIFQSDFSVKTEIMLLFQPCFCRSFVLSLSHRESIFPVSPFLSAWFCRCTTSFYNWLTLSIGMCLSLIVNPL